MERKRQPVRRVARRVARGSIEPVQTIEQHELLCGIFQIAGTLNQANGKRVTLAGGAQPKNIFWQVADSVTIGTTAHLEGVVLGKTLNAITQPAL